MSATSPRWDNDIGDLKLSEIEKDGLQVHRNYSRSFEAAAEARFARTIDDEVTRHDDLEAVVRLCCEEDARFVPVIACAFIDDRLKDMFEAHLPPDVPGGRAGVFSGYGPLSDLSKRLQLSFIFDMISQDVVRDLDRLRKARNTLSHTWDVRGLQTFFTTGTVSEVYPVDELLATRVDWAPQGDSEFSLQQKFRTRVVWLLARATYEAMLYARVRRLRLNPASALYGPNHPRMLTEVALIALTATRQILKKKQDGSI